MSKKKKQQVFGLGDLHQLTGFNKPKVDKPTPRPNRSLDRRNSPKSNTKPNIGWLFFKDYYHKFKFGKEDEKYQNDFFKNKNNIIFSQALTSIDTHLVRQKSAQSIPLKTTYPGLITGTGIKHETKSQGELKLGFAFDHTTGVPYLPASSVKGLLRSVFPQKEGKKTNKYAAEHRKYLTAHLAVIGITDLADAVAKKLQAVGLAPQNIPFDFIDLLEMEIFEGTYLSKKQGDAAKDATEDWEWAYYSIYQRDIFHDAFPKATTNPANKFLGADFITPHSNPLKNPKPIQLMKILPEVEFCFQFSVKDGWIPADKKLELFENLLVDLGIGGKTNVGYGQLVPTSKNN